MSANTIIREPLATLSPAKLALLEMTLKKQRRGGALSISRGANRESAPLSHNQQGLWVLNQLLPGSSIYHTPTAARLTGALDMEALRNALQAIIDRHAALRTTFVVVDGEPMQMIASNLSL